MDGTDESRPSNVGRPTVVVPTHVPEDEGSTVLEWWCERRIGETVADEFQWSKHSKSVFNRRSHKQVMLS